MVLGGTGDASEMPAFTDNIIEKDGSDADTGGGDAKDAGEEADK